MKRGRPPHPDILTPREWQVLDLLRRGLSNEQIADELSISRDGAKYHVAEILSKLGVASRQEAAAWRGEPVAQRGFLLLPFAVLLRRASSSTTAKLGAAAVVVLTLTAIAALALGVLAMSQRDGQPSGGSADGPPATPVISDAELACPVAADACRLAVAFLPAVRTYDGEAIAAGATPQTVTCPTVEEVDANAALSGLFTSCTEQLAGQAFAWYEFNNGKGSFYYDATSFSQTASEALTSAFGGGAVPPRILAVGCGSAGSQTPDCDAVTAALYGQDDGDGILVALVFVRSGDEWRIEKLWTPFPGVVAALPVEAGLQTGLTTTTGVSLIEWQPYDGPR